MKVHDEALWAQQKAELQADATGRDFLKFIETWTARAEELHGEGIGSWITALRHGLDRADQVHGRVSAHFLGQMLVVIATHWEHGEEAAADFSSIELRLVQDMLALKFAELQETAEADKSEGADNG